MPSPVTSPLRTHIPKRSLDCAPTRVVIVTPTGGAARSIGIPVAAWTASAGPPTRIETAPAPTREGDGRVVLAGDEQVADAVAGHVVHPDFAARVLEARRAQDAEDARARDGGVEDARDAAVAEEHEDLARIAASERAAPHRGEGQIVVAVAVEVVTASDRDSEAAVAGRAVQAEQAGRPARDVREVEAARRRPVIRRVAAPRSPGSARTAEGERHEGERERASTARCARTIAGCRDGARCTRGA